MNHSAETRDSAVARMREGETLASVHHDTGIPRSTLSDWARAAGLNLAEQSEAKTREAVLEHQRRATVARAERAERLDLLTDKAIARELELLNDEGTDLRAAVGCRTRAIHDAELLRGGVTERHETLAPERNDEQGEELAAVLELVRTDAA